MAKERRICGIYSITNLINGKRYIGQSRNIIQRWREHKSYLRRNAHTNEVLQRAWNKYSEENFNFEIIEECLLEELNDREIYLIKEYESNVDTDKGYNLDYGGNYPAGWSDLTKQKRIDAGIKKRIAIVQLDTNGNLIKIWNGGTTEVNEELGYDQSSIWRCCHFRKRSKTYKNSIWILKDYYDNDFIFNAEYYMSKTTPRPVIQLTINNEFIKEWDVMNDAGTTLKCGTGSIANCCKGIKKTSGGFRWAYKDDYEKGIDLFANKVYIKYTSVIQVTMEGEFIKEWDKIAQAAKELNINKNNISACCAGIGRTKSAGGYIWIYKSDYDDHELAGIFVNKRKKPVVQLTLDNVFVKEWDMIVTASKSFGMIKSGIQDCCKKRQKTARGFKWIYKEEYEQLNNNDVKEAI